MDSIQQALKIVPAVHKQELLFYIAEHAPASMLRITTHGGMYYTGMIVSIGTVRNADHVLVLQMMDERMGLLNRFLHLEVSSIETVELIGPEDLVKTLSLGKSIRPDHYEESGKLEVRRVFQSFADAVLTATGVPIGLPVMELPDNGFALNRILKITQKIQPVVIDILKQDDARNNWTSAYTRLAFINGDTLAVKGNNGILEIHFPFEDLSTPEIIARDLTGALMAIL